MFYNDKSVHNCENCWFLSYSLRKKRSCSELFWSVFSHIPTEYGEIRSISTFSVRMRENADQDNSEYGHFSRSDSIGIWDHMSPRFAESQKIKSGIINQHLDFFVKIFWPHYIYIHCNAMPLVQISGQNLVWLQTLYKKWNFV